MSEPLFLTCEAVIDIHEDELAVSGGLPGIRDRNALESAVAAPKNLYAYENGDLVAMAAGYLFALTKNHGFCDGNKRTAYTSCLTFLALNGIELGAPSPLELATLAVGNDLLERDGLTGLLRQLVQLLGQDPAYYAQTYFRQTPAKGQPRV